MEHVSKALKTKEWAAETPLQIVIDRPVHKYDVIVRSLTQDGNIHWHGSPLQTIAKNLTHSELLKFVNRELEHPQIKGWRVYGGGSPSAYGLRVGEFIKPHLSYRQLDLLAKAFKAKAGGL